MTGDDAIQEGANPRIGSELAEAIAKHFKESQDDVLAVEGRIGAQPNVRHVDGTWYAATWAGAGKLMFNEFDEEDVVDLIQSGPFWRLESVEENEAWQAAIEEGYIRG